MNFAAKEAGLVKAYTRIVTDQQVFVIDTSPTVLDFGIETSPQQVDFGCFLDETSHTRKLVIKGYGRQAISLESITIQTPDPHLTINYRSGLFHGQSDSLPAKGTQLPTVTEREITLTYDSPTGVTSFEGVLVLNFLINQEKKEKLVPYFGAVTKGIFVAESPELFFRVFRPIQPAEIDFLKEVISQELSTAREHGNGNGISEDDHDGEDEFGDDSDNTDVKKAGIENKAKKDYTAEEMNLIDAFDLFHFPLSISKLVEDLSLEDLVVFSNELRNITLTNSFTSPVEITNIAISDPQFEITWNNPNTISQPDEVFTLCTLRFAPNHTSLPSHHAHQQVQTLHADRQNGGNNALKETVDIQYPHGVNVSTAPALIVSTNISTFQIPLKVFHAQLSMVSRYLNNTLNPTLRVKTLSFPSLPSLPSSLAGLDSSDESYSQRVSEYLSSSLTQAGSENNKKKEKDLNNYYAYRQVGMLDMGVVAVGEQTSFSFTVTNPSMDTDLYIYRIYTSHSSVALSSSAVVAKPHTHSSSGPHNTNSSHTDKGIVVDVNTHPSSYTISKDKQSLYRDARHVIYRPNEVHPMSSGAVVTLKPGESLLLILTIAVDSELDTNSLDNLCIISIDTSAAVKAVKLKLLFRAITGSFEGHALAYGPTFSGTIGQKTLTLTNNYPRPLELLGLRSSSLSLIS